MDGRIVRTNDETNASGGSVAVSTVPCTFLCYRVLDGVCMHRILIINGLDKSVHMFHAHTGSNECNSET